MGRTKSVIGDISEQFTSQRKLLDGMIILVSAGLEKGEKKLKIVMEADLSVEQLRALKTAFEQSFDVAISMAEGKGKEV